MIRAYVYFDKLNKDSYLTHFEVTYDISVHISTSFTSFYLIYDPHPRIILLEELDEPCARDFLSRVQKWIRIAKDNTAKRNESMSAQETRKRLLLLFKFSDKFCFPRNTFLQKDDGELQIRFQTLPSRATASPKPPILKIAYDSRARRPCRGGSDLKSFFPSTHQPTAILCANTTQPNSYLRRAQCIWREWQ